MAESFYNDIAQRYFAIKNELHKLRMEQHSIARQIGQYEEELDELDSVLCKYGKHVYEGFKIEDNKDG